MPFSDYPIPCPVPSLPFLGIILFPLLEKFIYLFQDATHITSFVKMSTNIRDRILFVLFFLFVAFYMYLCYCNMFIVIICVNLTMTFNFPLCPIHTPFSKLLLKTLVDEALWMRSVSQATLLGSHGSRHVRQSLLISVFFSAPWTYVWGS